MKLKKVYAFPLEKHTVKFYTEMVKIDQMVLEKKEKYTQKNNAEGSITVLFNSFHLRFSICVHFFFVNRDAVNQKNLTFIDSFKFSDTHLVYLNDRFDSDFRLISLYDLRFVGKRGKCTMT